MRTLLTSPPGPIGLQAFVPDFERKASNLTAALADGRRGDPGRPLVKLAYRFPISPASGWHAAVTQCLIAAAGRCTSTATCAP
jgi:hypothetical protein